MGVEVGAGRLYAPKKQAIMLPFSTFFFVLVTGPFIRSERADRSIIRELLTASLFVYFVVRMPKPYPSL